MEGKSYISNCHIWPRDGEIFASDNPNEPGKVVFRFDEDGKKVLVNMDGYLIMPLEKVSRENIDQVLEGTPFTKPD